MRLPLLVLVAALAGCASYGVPLPEIAPEINSTLYLGPTLIRPGDVVDVQFPRKAGWNTSSVVRMDGRMSFPLLGELTVAGLTIAELHEQLAARYAEVPEQPEVHVNLGNPGIEGRGDSSAVVVAGEVGAPGAILLGGQRITLIDAIGRAGGALKESALLGNTLLVRRSPRTGTYQAWRIDARVEHWARGDPVVLQPDDLVYVPNTPVDNVNIWIDKYIRQNDPLTGGVPFLAGILVGGR